MSPLTKALVVLVTVLAVLELGMFVAYSAKHTDLSQQLQAERTARRAADESARAKQAEVNAAQDRINQVTTQFNDQIVALSKELSDARTAQRDAEAQIKSERARNEKTEAAIARLTAAAQQDAVLREALNNELKTAREQIVDLRTKNVELADALNAQTSSNESLVRQSRRYAEQIADLSNRLEQLQKEIVALGGTVPSEGAVAAGPPAAIQPIQGRVTQVDTSTDVPIVAVNVGANDGVAKGMQFMVHRGEQYLGKLVIDRVDADVAAGRMTLVRGAVQANDAVYTGPY